MVSKNSFIKVYININETWKDIDKNLSDNVDF